MSEEMVSIVVGLIGLLLGAIVGGGSVLIVMSRVVKAAKTDESAIRLGEMLFDSIPSDLARELVRDAVEYLFEVTDGDPLEEQAPDPDDVSNDKG